LGTPKIKQNDEGERKERERGRWIDRRRDTLVEKTCGLLGELDVY
jgi:hypothetical protein